MIRVSFTNICCDFTNLEHRIVYHFKYRSKEESHGKVVQITFVIDVKYFKEEMYGSRLATILQG